MKTRKEISKEEQQGHNLKEALRQQGQPESPTSQDELTKNRPSTRGDHTHTGRDGGDRR